jgi:hypothetical protein
LPHFDQPSIKALGASRQLERVMQETEAVSVLDQLFFFFVNWGQVITGVSLILIVILLFVIAARLKNLRRY